jgi:hypothetical protein
MARCSFLIHLRGSAFLGGICTGAGVGAGDDEDVADDDDEDEDEDVASLRATPMRGTPRRGDASSSSERRERASSAGFAEAPSSPK